LFTDKSFYSNLVSRKIIFNELLKPAADTEIKLAVPLFIISRLLIQRNAVIQIHGPDRRFDPETQNNSRKQLARAELTGHLPDIARVKKRGQLDDLNQWDGVLH
jgi:hypothetical protein